MKISLFAVDSCSLPARAQDTPPHAATPAHAETVMFIVELTGSDPAAFRDDLASAPVIPIARLASGINDS